MQTEQRPADQDAKNWKRMKELRRSDKEMEDEKTRWGSEK